MLHIIKIMNDSFCQIRIAPQAVHLRPSSDPGFYRVASVVMWDLVLEIQDQFRAFRARCGARPGQLPGPGGRPLLAHRVLLGLGLAHRRDDGLRAALAREVVRDGRVEGLPDVGREGDVEVGLDVRGRVAVRQHPLLRGGQRGRRGRVGGDVG